MPYPAGQDTGGSLPLARSSVHLRIEPAQDRAGSRESTVRVPGSREVPSARGGRSAAVGAV